MANTYYTDAAVAGVPAIAVMSGLTVVPFSFNIANTVSSAGFGNGDTLNLVPVPKVGNVVQLVGLYLSMPALDTNGTPTAEAKLGDSGSSTRYLPATSTLPQAAFNNFIQSANAFVAGSLPNQYSASDMLALVITAAVATPATTGTIKGYAMLYCGAGSSL